MKSTDLSFLVLGAGAIGGITTANLKKKGYEVEILFRDEEYASFIWGRCWELRKSGKYLLK